MTFKNLFAKTKIITEDAIDITKKTTKRAKKFVDENKDDFQTKTSNMLSQGTEIAKSSAESTAKTVEGLYQGFKYSDKDIKQLQVNIQNQGAMYRELNRNTSTAIDAIFLGGETLVNLLAATHIPEEITKAYESAYPRLSEEISFTDKVRELDSEQLTGFISGVKGKLFEMKYMDYLNNSNLPDGYNAFLAPSATQTGWDIGIEGPHGEISNIIQAKATDSVSYIQNAIEKYPDIDIVTTDEVYSHLIMSGISDNISNSTIENTDLIDQLLDSVDATNIGMDFTPPLFTLAFIAFTSYNEKHLSLFVKSKNAGDRAGKTYLSYLIGTGLAVATNTWWIGVIGSVGSRLISDQGKRKYIVYEKLKKVEIVNQKIIDRMKQKNQLNSILT